MISGSRRTSMGLHHGPAGSTVTRPWRRPGAIGSRSRCRELSFPRCSAIACWTPRRLSRPRYVDESSSTANGRSYTSARAAPRISTADRASISSGIPAWPSLREIVWPFRSAILDGEAGAGDGHEGIQAVFEQWNKIVGAMGHAVSLASAGPPGIRGAGRRCGPRTRERAPLAIVAFRHLILTSPRRAPAPTDTIRRARGAGARTHRARVARFIEPDRRDHGSHRLDEE